MTVERDRPVRMPSENKLAELEMVSAIRAVGLPVPDREVHFMWCCEHSKRVHREGPGSTAGSWQEWCEECDTGARRFHRFRRDRDFRFDLAWPDRMLALEVDGGVHSGGRHTRGAGFKRDCEKGNEAVLRGWRVLHVTPDMVSDGRALEWVERALGVSRQ